MIVDRWDEEQGRWRHWKMLWDVTLGMWVEECEVDEIGLEVK